jgi:hypothetical protein
MHTEMRTVTYHCEGDNLFLPGKRLEAVGAGALGWVIQTVIATSKSQFIGA